MRFSCTVEFSIDVHLDCHPRTWASIMTLGLANLGNWNSHPRTTASGGAVVRFAGGRCSAVQ